MSLQVGLVLGWCFLKVDTIVQCFVASRVFSGPVLRYAARLSQRYPLLRCGVFGVSTWPLGCDTPSPFSEHFPLGEHSRTQQKGYLSGTCAIPHENKARGAIPP